MAPHRFEELSFCGANRLQDLERLKAAFARMRDDVEHLRPLSPRTGAAPDAPFHQVVLIHGERGHGKTRLVMEFYLDLLRRLDPSGYWPKRYRGSGPNVEVMPRDEDCTFETLIPFLWLGVSLRPDNRPGEGLDQLLNRAFAHMTAMRIAQRVQQRRREVNKEAGDFSADLGLDTLGGDVAQEIAAILAEWGVEVAGEVIRLGLIKRTAEAVLKTYRLIKDREKDRQDPLSQRETTQQSRGEALLDDLDAILNPTGPTFAQRPAVLFIDDAQFADSDPSLTRFLEQLIARSKANCWPLLLVFTHWSRELNERANAQGEPLSPSFVSQMLNHARHGAPTTKGTFAGMPGGALADEHFTEIALTDPVEDLAPSLRTAFPGLDDETADTLLAQVGGNPRKLNEIATAMDLDAGWFENADTSSNLTDVGKQQVLSLSRRETDDIIYQRLCGTPPEVRRSVALASLVGSRFVVDLVERLSLARLPTATRHLLEEAERPYHLLRGVADRSRNDIADFPDTLFWQAAERYRHNARRDDPDWPTDDLLTITLDELLTDFVKNSETFEGLTAEDKAQYLNLAAQRMTAQNDPLTGLALARLVEVENNRGNFEGAYEAAERFNELYPNLADIPLNLADEVANTLWRKGHGDGAERIWRAHLSLSTFHANNNPNDFNLQHDIAISLKNIGNGYARKGDHEGSLAAYRQAHNFLEHLSSVAPANLYYQRGLAQILAKIGISHFSFGQLEEALSVFQESLQIQERLIQADPNNPDWQRDVSLSLNRIANIHAVQSNPEKALAVYRRAFKIREDLSKKAPRNLDRQSDLATSLANIASSQLALSNTEEALTCLRQSLEIRQRLSNIDRSNVEWQRELFTIFYWTGEALNTLQGREAEAVANFHDAFKVAEFLAEIDSTNTEWQRDLIIAHAKLAEMDEEPEAHYTAALNIARTLSELGQLAPRDEGILEDLERRLAQVRSS